MAGENTESTSLPEIYKMLTWDLNAEKLKANDKNGDGKLGWRERRKANRWIKNESHTARDLFDSNQRDLFLKSVQAHRAAALERQAAPPTIVEEPVVEEPVEAATIDVSDEQDPPVVRTPVATNWAKVATDNGFASVDDVKNFQTRMGLTVDGKAGKDTLAAKQWYDTMKGNGYTEVSTNGNPMYFMHGNNKFYMNGTSVIGGRSGTYDYTKMQKIVAQPISSSTPSTTTATTTSASQPIIPRSSNITEDQFRNSKYFRPHYLGRKYIEIEGKRYPMMVTQNIEKNHPLGLLNDQTYVLDLDTGKLRAVGETPAGLVLNNIFDRNSKWIDASNLFTEELTQLNEALSSWQTWLAANPKPINNFTLESRRASLLWERAANEKRKELGFQRQGGQLISKKAKGGNLDKKLNNNNTNITMTRVKYFKDGGSSETSQQPQYLFNTKAVPTTFTDEGRIYWAKDDKGLEKQIEASEYDPQNPMHRVTDTRIVLDQNGNPTYKIRRHVTAVVGPDGKITQEESYRGNTPGSIKTIISKPVHDLHGPGAQEYLRNMFYAPTTDVPHIHQDGRGVIQGNDALRYTDRVKLIQSMNAHKQGGRLKTRYFQQGGAAPQQDMQQQIIQLVQAAMQGDQKATETINQIMQAAQQGDQQAAQIAQMIQQVAQQMQGQATAAKWGAKLGYLRSLKYAKGGKTCPTCNQEIEMKKCGGKKAKKRYFGGWL